MSSVAAFERMQGPAPPPAGGVSFPPAAPLSGAVAEHAHALLTHLRTAFQPYGSASLLSARTRERAALGAFLDRTLHAGRGGSIYVTGQPGTGKTILVTALLEQRRATHGMGPFPPGTFPSTVSVDGASASAAFCTAATGADTAAAAADGGGGAAGDCARLTRHGSRPPFRLVWLNAMDIDGRSSLDSVLAADQRAAEAASLARPVGYSDDDDDDDNDDVDDEEDVEEDEGEFGAGSDGSSRRARARRARTSNRGRRSGGGGGHRAPHMTVLVVDEVDQLLIHKSKSALFKLFSTPHRAGSALVLIAIANKVSLTTDNTLPLLAQEGISPPVVAFAPYERDTLIAIAEHRVATTVAEALPALTGDARASGLRGSYSNGGGGGDDDDDDGDIGAAAKRARLAHAHAFSTAATTAAPRAQPSLLSRVSALAQRLVFPPDAVRLCAMSVAKDSGDARMLLAHCMDALVEGEVFARAARCPWSVAEKKAALALATTTTSAAAAAGAGTDRTGGSRVEGGRAQCTCVAGALYSALMHACGAGAAGAALATAAVPAGLPLVQYRTVAQIVSKMKSDKNVAPLITNLPRAQLTLLLVLAVAESFRVDGVVDEKTTISVFASKCAGILKGLSLPTMTAVAVDDTLELLRCSGAVDVVRGTGKTAAGRKGGAAAQLNMTVKLNVSLEDVLMYLEDDPAFKEIVGRVRSLVDASNKRAANL